MTQTAVRTQVHLIGRAEFNNGLVLYRVTGTNHVHDVSWNGTKVTACVTADGPCQSFFYRHTCSHSRYVRGLEEARMEQEAHDAEAEQKRIEREQWNEFQFQCGAYDHYWN